MIVEVAEEVAVEAEVDSGEAEEVAEEGSTGMRIRDRPRKSWVSLIANRIKI